CDRASVTTSTAGTGVPVRMIIGSASVAPQEPRPRGRELTARRAAGSCRWVVVASGGMVKRFWWADTEDSLMVAYHDEEWGVPSHDDRFLFEMLTLEGAQAGLSWSTILHKRAGYRKAFAGFDPAKVAKFTARRVERLLENPAIVRNRGKVESVVA